jgi:lipid-A-disaccharide synthase-like uncharacterized protein
VFETLGLAGIAISMLAYVPQVVHLGREHCSAGVSPRAWAMWLASSLLIGTLAIHRGDLVFVVLQISTLTSAAIILVLARRYRGMVCEAHALNFQPQSHSGRPWPSRLSPRRAANRVTAASATAVGVSGEFAMVAHAKLVEDVAPVTLDK